MKFAVESWDPAYGSSTADPDMEASDAPVEADHEVPASSWAPIDPGPADRGLVVTFVDGVRRVDSRVWIDDGQRSHLGLCATVAAGSVTCVEGGAMLGPAQIERGLYSAVPNAARVPLPNGGAYEPKAAASDDDGSLFLAIHNHMTAVEEEVSAEAVGAVGPMDAAPPPRPSGLPHPDLLILDGPLRGRETTEAVGYVKTHHVLYLDAKLQRVVAELRPGQRTPLFLIGGHFARWSWYMRLPGPVTHPYSGIARLELPFLGDADSAAGRADTITAVLPRYASEPHKDARAPQNLYPIAGLERELRRRLGDAQLLERFLRRAAMV